MTVQRQTPAVRPASAVTQADDLVEVAPGLRTLLRDEGQGRVVVLLHGTPFDVRAWDPLVGALGGPGRPGRLRAARRASRAAARRPPRGRRGADGAARGVSTPGATARRPRCRSPITASWQPMWWRCWTDSISTTPTWSATHGADRSLSRSRSTIPSG